MYTNQNDMRFGFGFGGFGRRPFGFGFGRRPFGFGFPLGFLGGLALGAAVGGPYPYYPPYPYYYPPYPYYYPYPYYPWY